MIKSPINKQMGLLLLICFVFSFTQCSKTPTDNNEVPPNDDRPVDNPSTPELTIFEPEFDFGIVPQHSKISHIFWLHSTGYDTLVIDKIIPG